MSLDVPTITTELDAVNLMLGAIQTAPISGFTDPVPAEIVGARSLLEKICVKVQTKGWHFNTEIDYVLTPDSINNFITLGSNIVRVDLNSIATHDLVQRGTRLYDRKNRTFVFPAGVDLKAEVVIMLPWLELPESARAYIALRASRKFQQSLVGDAELDGFTQKDEFDAWTDLMEFEGDTRDHNIFNSWDVFRTIDRTNLP